ncbi:BnaA02g12560D [Brassica napus]|uniref:(rape) hypothetical protein n=1 Tax=Brassica napus TaxID=3708 RepID=A0A078FKD1_BRANA|nr:unnamed protein product [Brassica napus]CDY12588.1 BnaA02g12560D [Brassica napus]
MRRWLQYSRETMMGDTAKTGSANRFGFRPTCQGRKSVDMGSLENLLLDGRCSCHMAYAVALKLYRRRKTPGLAELSTGIFRATASFIHRSGLHSPWGFSSAVSPVRRPMCLLVPTATRISQRDDGEPPRRSPTTDPPSSSRFIFKSCSSSIREHDSVISQHRPLVNP